MNEPTLMIYMHDFGNYGITVVVAASLDEAFELISDERPTYLVKKEWITAHVIESGLVLSNEGDR